MTLDAHADRFLPSPCIDLIEMFVKCTRKWVYSDVFKHCELRRQTFSALLSFDMRSIMSARSQWIRRGSAWLVRNLSS